MLFPVLVVIQPFVASTKTNVMAEPVILHLKSAADPSILDPFLKIVTALVAQLFA